MEQWGGQSWERTMEQAVVHLLGEAQESFEDCSPSSFCTACPAAVCQKCCRDHLERHPHELGVVGGRILQVRDIHGSPAVSARTVKKYNLGYNWNYIQRLGEPYDTWIHLRPAPFHHNGRYACSCGHKVTKDGTSCSPACKLYFVDGGGVRHLVQAMVDADYQAPRHKDRYCTLCELIFSSGHCANHEGHHDPNAQAETVVSFVVQDGRVFFPEEQVPPPMSEGVMRVPRAGGDGGLLVALRPRELEDLPPVAPGPLCRHPDCAEAVELDAQACSIRCR